MGRDGRERPLAELARAVLSEEAARLGDGGHATGAGGREAGPAGAGGDTPLLEVHRLDVALGTRQVLFGVDLDVAPGEVLALLGTNGAGKTTLLRTVSGLEWHPRGAVRFAGEDLAGADAARRVDLGIGQVPGGHGVFPHLSVLDNLLVGCHRFAWQRDLVRARIERVVGLFPRIGERLDQRAGTLSGGEQQMLALAKALVLEPRLLLVDELSLGLAPVVVHQLLEVVAGLAAAGTTVVMVEQSLDTALAIAERAVWLEKGQIRFDGPAVGLRHRDDLVRAVFRS